MNTLPETLILPPRTVSMPGAALALLAECAAFGARGILVHGRSLERSGRLGELLSRRPDSMDVQAWCHPGGEPTLAQLGELLVVAREYRPQWIAAVGGGSVMDVAKACAGLLEAPLTPVAYHDGAEIAPTRIRFIAAPTTAGTGSESTIVSVLTNADTGVKKSIRHPSFMAGVVILDPELLAGCPRTVIASSGMDALAQAVESFVSNRATWFSDSLALRAVQLISGSLEAVHSGAGGGAARDLMAGSYLAGLALSLARLGLVHGLAHPLGFRYHAAHGLVCAVCLPPVLEFNREVIGEKYDRMCTAVGGDMLTRTRDLLRALETKSPFYGQPAQDLPGIVEETLASGSTAANPRLVTAQDVEDMVGRIFRG